MEVRNALIFGCNGFVGGWLAQEFSAHGWRVTGADVAKEARYSQYDRYYPCDLLDTNEVTRVVVESECDSIVNLAAISSVSQSWRSPRLTMHVNVIGAMNLLDAVRTLARMPRVLLIGSSEEYATSDYPLQEGDPIDATNPYGVSKVAQERMALLYAREYNVPVCLTRSFNHTGLGQADTFVLSSWCKQVAEIDRSGRAGTLGVGNLHVIRDFSDVRDVCRAYRLILESDSVGEVFNVGSGRAYSLEVLASKIASFAHVPVSIVEDSSRVRRTDVPSIVCDPTHLKAVTGWLPKYNIEITLREMYEAFRKK